MTKITTSTKRRRPTLSASVRAGLASIADGARPETVEQIKAIAWIRETLAVLESRQLRRQDAGAVAHRQ